MSSRVDADRLTAQGMAEGEVELHVDRVACTGHGVCAGVLPQSIELDEWGYPIVRDPQVGAEEAATAIRLCPARALYRT